MRWPRRQAEGSDVSRQRNRAAEAAVRTALAEGRVFAAYNLACEGLREAPHGEMLHLLAATALVRSGAVEAARSEIMQTRVGAAALDALDAGSEPALQLAEVLEELWQAGGSDAERARALAIRLERARIRGHFADQARAAMLAQAGGDGALARDLAQAALRRGLAAADASTRQLLELAELCLLVDDPRRAEAYLQELAQLQRASPMARARIRHRLALLAEQGIAIDPGLVSLFDPATLMVFAGIAPGQMPGGGLSASLEAAIGKAIGEQLALLEPAIAYGSAAAGCDLLFALALLARGAELNIILPFQRDSFRARLVAPHGGGWLARFDHVLAAAASVTDVSGEQYFDQAILQFGNQVIDGTARLRGAALASPPYLVAVWDYLAAAVPGGPSDFIDHWGDPSRLRLIGLDELAAGPPGTDVAPVAAAPRRDAGDGQRIASMMFADVVGFSRIHDTQLAAFWRFMRAVAFHMDADAPKPDLIDSWGDAILAVHGSPLAAADYATALATAFATIDSRHFGLPERLRLRVGLHAGPVFEGEHPITHQHVVYGSNVNRAARIEPITVPGLVYASDQFVAVLTAEESAAEAEIRLAGREYRPRYRCNYRGVLELAKGYGIQAVYEVEPWRSLAGGRVILEPGVRLHVTLANDLEEHRRLSSLFARLVEPLAPADDVLRACETAIDEIMTNICHYAWDDEAKHVIDVEILVSDGRIEATFTDDGAAFDPLAVAPMGLDSDLDERVTGGLGIHLVKALMDDLRYRRDGALNCLTFVKQLGERGSQANRKDGAGSHGHER